MMGPLTGALIHAMDLFAVEMNLEPVVWNVHPDDLELLRAEWEDEPYMRAAPPAARLTFRGVLLLSCDYAPRLLPLPLPQTAGQKA